MSDSLFIWSTCASSPRAAWSCPSSTRTPLQFSSAAPSTCTSSASTSARSRKGHQLSWSLTRPRLCASLPHAFGSIDSIACLKAVFIRKLCPPRTQFRACSLAFSVFLSSIPPLISCWGFRWTWTSWSGSCRRAWRLPGWRVFSSSCFRWCWSKCEEKWFWMVYSDGNRASDWTVAARDWSEADRSDSGSDSGYAVLAARSVRNAFESGLLQFRNVL